MVVDVELERRERKKFEIGSNFYQTMSYCMHCNSLDRKGFVSRVDGWVSRQWSSEFY
jgi:hypothetical protein